MSDFVLGTVNRVEKNTELSLQIIKIFDVPYYMPWRNSEKGGRAVEGLLP